MRPVIYNWPAENPQALMVNQTVTAPGNIPLNGPYGLQPFPGFSRTVTVSSSTGAFPGFQFTITGLYQTQPLTVVFPSTALVGGSFETTAYFDVVTSISIVSTGGTFPLPPTFSAGWGVTGHTHYFVWNTYTNHPSSSTAVQVVVNGGGKIAYGCFGSLFDPSLVYPPTYLDGEPPTLPNSYLVNAVSTMASGTTISAFGYASLLNYIAIFVEAGQPGTNFTAIFCQQGI